MKTESTIAQKAAAALSRQAARKLADTGLSGREIAVVLRVSPQRVSQLLKSDKPGTWVSAAKREVTVQARRAASGAQRLRAESHAGRGVKGRH